MKPEATHSLTPKQNLAIPLLLAGCSGIEVAEQLKVKASTVSEWLNHNPAFAHKLSAARAEALEAAKEELQSCALLAVRTLRKILESSKSDIARLRACEIVLRGLPTSSDHVPSPAQGGVVNLSLVLQGLGIKNGK